MELVCVASDSAASGKRGRRASPKPYVKATSEANDCKESNFALVVVTAVFQASVLRLEGLALRPKIVVIRNFQQHPGITVGQRGDGHDSHNTERQYHMNEIKWKTDLMEIPMRTREDQKGIELLIHELGHPKPLSSTLIALA